MTRLIEAGAKNGLAVAVAMSALFILGGCSTFVVKGDYTPRLSARSEMLKEAIAKKKDKPTFYVLKFEDQRGVKDASTANCHEVSSDASTLSRLAGKNCVGIAHSTKPEDANIVFVARGTHSYVLEDKTVAAYLREALIFDLKRFGFSVRSGEPGEPRAEDMKVGTTGLGIPDDVDYVLGIWVYRFELDWKTGFSTVTPVYTYDYGILLRNAGTGKIELEEKISKTIKTVAVPFLTFAEGTDELMNDGLAEMNLAIAEALLRYD